MLSSPHFLEEVVDFITSTPSPEAVLSFAPSEAAQSHLEILLEKKRADAISPEEEAELDYYMFLEYLIRMTKLKAATQ